MSLQLFTIYSLTAIITDFFVQSSAVNLVSALWQLMEGGLEELRILQTIILLITTSNIVHGECLGKVSHFFTFPLKLMIQFYAGMVFIICRTGIQRCLNKSMIYKSYDYRIMRKLKKHVHYHQHSRLLPPGIL